MELVVVRLSDMATITYDDKYGWSASDLPINKNVNPGCNALFILTADVPRLAIANIHPLPEWICDEAEMLEWLP